MMQETSLKNRAGETLWLISANHLPQEEISEAAKAELAAVHKEINVMFTAMVMKAVAEGRIT